MGSLMLSKVERVAKNVLSVFIDSVREDHWDVEMVRWKSENFKAALLQLKFGSLIPSDLNSAVTDDSECAQTLVKVKLSSCTLFFSAHPVCTRTIPDLQWRKTIVEHENN